MGPIPTGCLLEELMADDKTLLNWCGCYILVTLNGDEEGEKGFATCSDEERIERAKCAIGAMGQFIELYEKILSEGDLGEANE